MSLRHVAIVVKLFRFYIAYQHDDNQCSSRH